MATLLLENLRVYSMAEELADVVWDVVQDWPGFAKAAVGSQLVRAADSVGANIAEGFGRASPVDHQLFVRTARGSLYETRHFLRRADKRKLLTKPQKLALRKLVNDLPPVLNGYLRSLSTKVV